MKQLLITIAALVLLGCGPAAPDISIHDAAANGNIEAVKQHIAADTDVNAKDKYVTPLHLAAWGHMEIAELLITNGADVNAKDEYGRTPLHNAASQSQMEIAELLIANGADVNAMGEDGKTPLDYEFRAFPNRNKPSKRALLLRKHGAKTGEELKAEGK